MGHKLAHCRHCGLKALKIPYDDMRWYYVHDNGYVQCPIDGRTLYVSPIQEDEVVDNILTKYSNEIQ